MQIESIKVPFEVWCMIFVHLDLSDLFTVGLASKELHRVQNSSLVWRPRCHGLWKDKKIPKQLFDRCNYSCIASMLPIRTIRRILKSRRIHTFGLLEKHEFVTLLIDSSPKEMPCFDWNAWKLSYFSSLWDSRRIRITTRELCEREWNFYFKDSPTDHHGLVSVFYEDYTYESAMFPDRFQWRFSSQGIQIEDYPGISVSRTSDWGWKLDNLVGFWLEADQLTSS
jgi:hypothetical protein